MEDEQVLVVASERAVHHRAVNHVRVDAHDLEQRDEHEEAQRDGHGEAGEERRHVRERDRELAWPHQLEPAPCGSMQQSAHASYLAVGSGVIVTECPYQYTH